MINEILKLVKKNKKYKYISDELIVDKIKKIIKGNEDLGKRDVQSVVKQIRAELHSSYGSFQIKKKKRDKYLEELKKNIDDLEIHKKILMTNVSTKERLRYYNEIYKIIFGTIGKPRKIVDLGCGLNVFSFPFMGLDKLEYYGFDISKDDMDFINEYIEVNPRISGKAEVFNILSGNFSQIPKSEVYFLFKLFDSLVRDYKFIEKLILSLKGTIVVSFATKKLSQKRMKYPERRWFEYMLERLDLKFKKFEIENEVFYMIVK